nr:hypothetical protein [Tanacetum cinerariifolium]
MDLVFCWVRIHQGGKILSSLAVNVKNFEANPDSITIMIIKDNYDVMNTANTSLRDNSIPKMFYTSNWVHNEPLKAMKIRMSRCIKSGVYTDKLVQNVTTNPKVDLNKLMNKKGVQVGMGKKTLELEQKWWITVLPLRHLSSYDLVFTGN